MSKTIKQLADELGVSKTAVRNYMSEEFRAKYTEKDCKGVIIVTPDGCKLIAESFGKTANDRKESAETALITVPLAVWKTMEDQVKVKDEQLAAKDAQILALTAALESTSASLQAAQALHAGTLQQSLPDPEAPRKWWQRKKS